MLWLNLIVAGVMVVLTFTIHFMGLVGLSAVLRQRGVHPVNLKSVFAQGVSILFVVISLFALHSIQIWAYAFVYLALGQFEGIEPALYFSTSTFTTVGFGDVLPHDDWRMLGAAEGANGFLLIGWSTAFLVAVTARVRAFEADIERLDD
ncbi:MAG: potassium channel family protein [Alphaproteobacteria bacterium]|nr:potassium channel family protein [Alphaproteobacteria bacterium]